MCGVAPWRTEVSSLRFDHRRALEKGLWRLPVFRGPTPASEERGSQSRAAWEAELSLRVKWVLLAPEGS